jgi:hypothetical protein
MFNRSLCAVLALGMTGCVVNGKKMFGLGGSSSSSSGPTSSGPAPDPSEPGSPAVKAGPAPASYAWCKDVQSDDDLERALSDDFDWGLPAISGSLCKPEDDKTRAARDQIEARRQAWMAKLHLTEADWATDVIEWGNIDFSRRNTPYISPNHKAAWSTIGPVEQFALIAIDTGMSDSFALANGAETYMADAFKPTEAGRLAYVIECIKSDDVRPVLWATCQADIEALDFKKIAAELRADKGRSMHDRMVVRRAYAQIQDRLAKHPARVKELFAKDPAYAKMFEIAKAARKEWQENVRGRAEALAVVAAMDDARVTNSKKALDGCVEKAWPHFTAAVSKLGAKRFENITDDRKNGVTFTENALGAVLATPEGYLAANALVSCQGQQYDYLNKNLGDGLAYRPGFRGPRTAAMTAIRAANLELDERGAKISYPDFRLPLAMGDSKTKGDGYVKGVVASVKTEGDLVKITFPKSSGNQEYCASSKRTGRISRIDGSGNIYYESVCLKYATERIDTTPAPVTVDKRYAAGVKPGVYVATVGGIVEAVWAKSSSPMPNAAFGALLK